MALTQKVKEAIDKNDVDELKEIFEHTDPVEFLREVYVPVVRGPPQEQVATKGSLLFYAVQKRLPDVVRYLLEVGADPFQKTSDDSGTPIQQAALLQDQEILRMLFSVLPSERYRRNAIASIEDAFFYYQMNRAPDKKLIDFLLSNGFDLTPPRQYQAALGQETMEWIQSFPERTSQAVRSAMIKKNVPQDVESIVRRFSGLQGGRRRKTRRRKGYTKRASKKQ